MNWLRDRRFWAGVGAMGALTVIIPLAIIEWGLPNMSALPKPDALEGTIGPWMLQRARAHRAPVGANPVNDDSKSITEGLDHYREDCMMCHGSATDPSAEFAEGFHPPAPQLTIPRITKLTDGELFWTVKNGVRMTGMPGFGGNHTDQEIWSIVAAVRHLAHLSDSDAAHLMINSSSKNNDMHEDAK